MDQVSCLLISHICYNTGGGVDLGIMQLIAVAQTPLFLASKWSKAISLTRTMLARKPRDFCSATMALMVVSARVVKIKDHCLPIRKEKESSKKAKGIKISYWR